jgi:hypothetical protein
MLLGRSTGDIPYLLKPAVEVFFTNSACFSLFNRWLSVAPWLALHQDELNIVLNDGIRLVRLSKELRSIFHLIGSVCDLVPDDWIQVVKADTPAYNANVGMKGKNQVTSKIASRDADIANNAHKTATRHKDCGRRVSRLSPTQREMIHNPEYGPVGRDFRCSVSDSNKGVRLRRDGSKRHRGMKDPVNHRLSICEAVVFSIGLHECR